MNSVNVKSLWESDPDFITSVAPLGGDDILSGSGTIDDPIASGIWFKGIGGGEVTLADGNKLVVAPDGSIIG